MLACCSLFLHFKLYIVHKKYLNTQLCTFTLCSCSASRKAKTCRSWARWQKYYNIGSRRLINSVAAVSILMVWTLLTAASSRIRWRLRDNKCMYVLYFFVIAYQGRPKGASESDVYVCEYRVDRVARKFQKITNHKYKVNIKSYCFTHFPQKLQPKRTCQVTEQQFSYWISSSIWTGSLFRQNV